MPALRVTYIDIARGLAIIAMVVGHCIGFGLGRDLIFAWHMPLFVLVSGMFITEGTSLRKVLARNARKLLLPYAVLELAVMGAAALIAGDMSRLAVVPLQIVAAFSFPPEGLTFIPSVSVLWFIPFLIVAQLVFIGVVKLAKRLAPAGAAREVLKAACALVLTLAGIVLGVNGIWLPWSADVALASVGFMYVGHELARLGVCDALIGNPRAAQAGDDGTCGEVGAPDFRGLSGRTLAIMAVLTGLFAVGVHLGTIELSVRHYPGALGCMATAVAGCMLVFWISALLERFSGVVGRGLAWCGKNSLYLLMAHFVEMNLVPYASLGVTSPALLIVCRFAVIAVLMMAFVLVRRALAKRKAA
ncbi:MAG: acyltransferase [Eggerthellaceae bacterium]|nr:acyltransferase [Eggerthellaceae bacterium]